MSRALKDENGEGGRTAASMYSRIQTVDSFEPTKTASTSSEAPPPPNFSPQDFPSLGGDVKPSKKNAPTTTAATKKPPEPKKDTKKSVPAPQPSQTSSTNSKKEDTDITQNQTSPGESKSLPNLEDTETVLYEKVIRRTKVLRSFFSIFHFTPQIPPTL